MPRTLVLIRHGKSDWGVAAGDRERPLARRGRRQAPAVGRWLAAQGVVLDLAIVSQARRARQTWELVAAELGDAAPPADVTDAAYTFDAGVLAEVIERLPDVARTVAIVGHNPALEETVATLTGTHVALPTAAVALVELPSWSPAAAGRGRLLVAGRPADGRGLDEPTA